jgi:LPS-assembly protein
MFLCHEKLTSLLPIKSARLLIILPLIFLVLSASAASFDGLTLEADDISRDYEKRTVTLAGHVHIAFDGESIRCQTAIINFNTQEIRASKDVSIDSLTSHIEGESITYNYKTKLGEIQNGLVESGQVIFMGDVIKKTADKNFTALSARYTSCTTCPAGWSFSGAQIDAELGGYAYIKYPVLRIADFPIFILPRIWIPIQSKRQTGVLVPSIDYSSKGGTAIVLPYFWAINKSQDLTYSIKTYEKRGLKHLAEYRYVLDDNSRGFLNGGYLHDKAFTADGQPTGITTELNRGFLTYSHYIELPEHYVQRTELNLVSDLRYPRDFSDEIAGHGDPALENKTSISKSTESQFISAETAFYTNLLKQNTSDSNTDAVHRFPEIKYSAMEKEILNSNLFFKFDFDYTNFSRNNLSYDDLNNNGVFDPATTPGTGDLIRTGHRFIFQPTLSYPFHIGHYLDVNPSIIYNETQYRFNFDPVTPITNYDRAAERRYIQTDISFKTKYSAVYESDSNSSVRYKHEIEPELIYSKIPTSKRTENIFFGNFEDQPYSRHSETVSNNDFNGGSSLQFDYLDRQFNKDLATLVLSNYIIRKDYQNQLAYYKKIFTFRVLQSYDFSEARRADPKPWSNINGLVDVRLNHFETHTTADYYPYAYLTNWSTRLKYIQTANNFFELTYSDNVIVKENQLISNQHTQSYGTGLGFKTKYLELTGRTNYSIITDRLESWEYLALFKPPGDCWSIKLGHKKTLGSDRVFKFSFNFEFSGI